MSEEEAYRKVTEDHAQNDVVRRGDVHAATAQADSIGAMPHLGSREGAEDTVQKLLRKVSRLSSCVRF